MNHNLLALLKFEHQLLKEMVSLAEQQQNHLIKFSAIELEKISSYQSEISSNLRLAEEKRIKILMNDLKMSRNQAMNLTMSEIVRNFVSEDAAEYKTLQKELKYLVNKLQNFNVVNRVLANRARISVRELLGFFTNGTNQVCNVKI